ncbi:MAG TPA: penicillin-binding transpeptidase domain-containing protein [Opitutaceae bacterium]|nr:penicillin-binding transpeptidase domain-containing protein [Opitutaceae bacterium]
MATADTNLADRSGSLVESHRNYQPRVVFFHFVILLLLLILVGGLAYQQVFKTDLHQDRQRMQSWRRTLEPGARGDLLDREGRVLAGNDQNLSVIVHLDALQSEFRREYIKIRTAYRESGDRDLPNAEQMEQIARVAVVQRYLDRVDGIIGRDEKIRSQDFDAKHFTSGMLQLPYLLLDDLTPEEFGRLTERLPVNSPVEIHTSSKRYYPYDSAAAHALGMVMPDPNIEAPDFPEQDLTTFKMKGTVGRDGLEKQFESVLEGETGGTIFQVDRLGYKVKSSVKRRPPRQGQNLTTSLDIDLQLAAEQSFAKLAGDKSGAVVAIEVKTGEVLALASAPSYNLNDVSPRISTDKFAEIEAAGGWSNRAVNGLYPPGSTFKILVSIAGLRAGLIDPGDDSINCTGQMLIGGRTYYCDRTATGYAEHGHIALREAIAQSCDYYFYTQGLKMSPEVIAAEARRFHLDQRTGIQLSETKGMIIPDPAWRERTRGEKWFAGDTANMSIGQGDVLVTPLEMACFAASVARGEVYTKPTLLHDPNSAPQHTEAIGLTAPQRAVLLGGMEDCTINGTAKVLTQLAALRIPGLRIAGKTGTAQIGNKRTVAWFICFAPLENPEIALAVAIEGDTPGEAVAGGLYSAPIAQAVLKEWWDKKSRPPGPAVSVKK